MADEKKPTQRRRLPKTQTPLRSTTRWIAERAARTEARTKDLEFIEAYLATPGPSSRSFVISRPATPFETRSEIMQVNRPEFYADAANPQLESAGPSTGAMFNIPAFESTHLLPRTQTPLRSTTLRTVEQAARGAGPFSRSFIIPRSATPYETQSEIIPMNRAGFNADAANVQLESAGPCTGLIFDKPSPEDSHVVAAQQPGTSQNHGIRPQRRNRIAMQGKPNNTASADGGSASK